MYRAAFAGLLMLSLAACATEQGRHVVLGSSVPARTADVDVEIFVTDDPTCAHVIQVHLGAYFGKVALMGSSLDEAIEHLKVRARLTGCDAIIDIRERRSHVGETRIYHVMATGIRYTNADPAR